MAFVALLMTHFRQSKRRVSLFCESVLNIPCSPGLVVKLQRRATAALRPHYEHLAAALPAPAQPEAPHVLRPAVIWRKLTFGTQSAAGSRSVETLLSIIETYRQQNRDLFTFMTIALTRHDSQRQLCSLCPSSLLNYSSRCATAVSAVPIPRTTLQLARLTEPWHTVFNRLLAAC